MNYAKQNPERYAPSSTHALAYGKSDFEAIRHCFHGLDKSARILEIGCGTGNLLHFLNVSGYKTLHGVEMSESLARHAQKEFCLRITQTDWVNFLSETAETFDMIIALDVVEHLKPEDCVAAMALSRAHLRSGGVLVLRTPSAECPFVLPTYCGDLTHRVLFSADLLEHTLKEAGFSGPIAFWETRPYSRAKRLLFMVVHHLLIRPMVTLLHFHFYQKRPRVITRNMYCAARV